MELGTQITRPQNAQEFMRKLEVPYDTKYPNPNVVYSEPQQLGQPEFNRAYQYSRKGDDKQYSIGIKDIDEALLYYFNEVLKLTVNQNNQKINVPTIYGNAENWKNVQQDGYIRDGKGKIMAPLLMFKRTSMTQNRNLGNKIDGNKANNVQIFEKSYTKRNFYSNFVALNSRAPEREYSVVIVPDYVTVEYTCIVWTYYVEQMDSLIEALNFASRSYWGDPNRFTFYSDIETFQDQLEFNLGDDRLVRCSFTIKLNGYLIPDTVNAQLAAINKAFGVTKIVFGMEIASQTENFDAYVKASQTAGASTIKINDSVNVTVNQGQIDPLTISYLSTNLQLQGTVVAEDTITFSAIWLTAPSGFPPTGLDNFTFFVNGALIEKNSIVSFTTDNIGTSTLVIDTTSLQFTLSDTDMVMGIGKFKLV